LSVLRRILSANLPCIASFSCIGASRRGNVDGKTGRKAGGRRLEEKDKGQGTEMAYSLPPAAFVPFAWFAESIIEPQISQIIADSRRPKEGADRAMALHDLDPAAFVRLFKSVLICEICG
jgi:hypothetical protein